MKTGYQTIGGTRIKKRIGWRLEQRVVSLKGWNVRTKTKRASSTPHTTRPTTHNYVKTAESCFIYSKIRPYQFDVLFDGPPASYLRQIKFF